MPFVDAALAFAITMLIVAIIVREIVGLIQGVLGWRHEKLKTFLKQFYSDQLKDTVDAELAKVDGALREELKGILDQLGKSPAKGLKKSMLDKENNISKKVGEVSTRDMIEGLRKSPFGEALFKKLPDQADRFLFAAAEEYQSFGEQFSREFKRRPQLVATVIAVVVALLVNVDSFHVVSTFAGSNDARTRAVAQADIVLANASAELGGRDPDVVPGVDEVRAQIDSLRTQITGLSSTPFPVMWDRFPYCRDAAQDARCGETGIQLDHLFWFIGCLLTGVLAGLGTPFWHDVVSGVAQFAHKRSGGRQRQNVDIEAISSAMGRP